MAPPFSLDEFYDAYPRIEVAFSEALDASLNPRGPDVLYDVVRDLRLPDGATVVDVGCGEGKHALKLGEMGFKVVGFDPIQRQIDLARDALSQRPDLVERVHFELGSAESLPVEDESIDLVWCRDVLVHVPSLEAVYSEFRRILRKNGRALVYQMFGTDQLGAKEAAWLFGTMGVVPINMDTNHGEAVMSAADLRIDERIDLSTEWGEWNDERGGSPDHLLRTARLLRDPRRYINQFGQKAYEIMLGDCLWHVYGMTGKLTRRAFLISRR